MLCARASFLTCEAPASQRRGRAPPLADASPAVAWHKLAPCGPFPLEGLLYPHTLATGCLLCFGMTGNRPANT